MTSGAEGKRDARPDVFLSYAHEDHERAKWAFSVLQARGWSVWFDEGLIGGDRWRREIDETLDDVGCVVVLWSAAAVSSNFVIDEAGEGLERGVLVPVLLEDVDIPLGFREIEAIDLVEARVRTDMAEAALVAAVSNVLSRPAIEPVKPSRLARVFRRWAPTTAAILPVAIAIPLLLRPTTRTVMDLNVTATEISFVSAIEQDMTDMMVVTDLAVDGLATIHLPRTRSAEEQVLAAAPGRGLGLRLAGGVEPAASGSVTLESITVPAATAVTVATLDSGRVRISLNGSSLPMEMSVEGPLRTQVGGGDTKIEDFGTPKPLSIVADPRGTDVTFRRVAGESRLVSSPLVIDALSLARIDETLDTRQTSLAVVSTIRSGTVRVDAPDGRERAIGAGERLRFGEPSGEIRQLATADGGLSLRFQGSISTIESCASDETCVNWMPSTLESIVAGKLLLVIAIAGAYLLGLLGLVRSRYGPGRGFLALLIAAGLFAPPGVSAQTGAVAREETIKRLVVRVESSVGFGSGIIVGSRSDTLFVVTANHVVRRGPAAADSVDVRFYWQPDVPVRASLLTHADDSLDLAVLSLSMSDASRGAQEQPPGQTVRSGAADVRAIPFDRLGDMESLERGDAIWLLGQPNGLPWRINTVAERFIGFRGASLDFESNLLARGHSGGALLNEDLEVVGMLKSDQAPYGEAVSIYAIARKLEEWGYPVDLRLRPAQILAGQGRTCVLSPRGETQCVGYDDRYEMGPIVFDMRLKQLSLNDDHACGIAARGRAFCVGTNANGQLGDGTFASHYDAPAEVAGSLTFESISAGSGHTCGVTTEGDVYCWGLAESGQLGTWFAEDRTTPVRLPTTEKFRSVSAIWQYSCGMTTDGAVHCWGAMAADLMLDNTLATRIAPEHTFVALTTGWYQVCGITTAGATLCWGYNDDGQLGTGSADDEFHEEPQTVSGNHSFTAISSGVSHACGLTAAGEAWCWGLNKFGQIGNGSTENSAVPVRVNGDHVFEAISAGDLHTCGLTTDGAVWCWGNNSIVGSHFGGGLGPTGQEMHTEPIRVQGIPEFDRRPWRR